MTLNEITFRKLYTQIVTKLKKLYNKSNTSFTAASPYGQILTVQTELFQLNNLQIQSVQKSFDINDPLNNNLNTIRGLAKIGQYNPTRAQSANGSIKLKLKAGVDINDDIKGGKLIFKNEQRLKNKRNNFEYVTDINIEEITYTLSNSVPISINIIQGVWDIQSRTGTGEINQSYTINAPNSKEIEQFRVQVYCNSELLSNKTHKHDMLQNEKACVILTSFNNGIDVLFGNGDEGFIPPLESKIDIKYLITDGSDGNINDYNINDFEFIEQPTDYFGNEIQVSEFFDIDVDTTITFGSDGESIEYLKSIMPYTSSNFVLAGPDQYKFFLKRLNFFSIIDVYTSKKNNNIKNEIFNLLTQNTNILNEVVHTGNSSSLTQLVSTNQKQVNMLFKSMLTEGGDNIVNIFLIPDIRTYFGKDNITNYFNIDLNLLLLDKSEKDRILNYLSSQALQIITNEVVIVDPIIKKYVISLTIRVYDDAIEENLTNNVTNLVSDYFINQTRRDRIPPSDIVRLVDSLYDVDSVTCEFISEENEQYHKEYIIKADEFNRKNNRFPLDSEIKMSDGKTYDSNKSIGIDSILGDILIDKQDLPVIRGNFTDRFNNMFSENPGVGQYSSINILILPEKTKRKQFN